MRGNFDRFALMLETIICTGGGCIPSAGSSSIQKYFQILHAFLSGIGRSVKIQDMPVKIQSDNLATVPLTDMRDDLQRFRLIESVHCRSFS